MSEKGKLKWLDHTAQLVMETELDWCCVVMKKKDGEVLTGYWNVNAMDKAAAASEIQMDAMLDMVGANRDYIKQQWEENEDD